MVELERVVRHGDAVRRGGEHCWEDVPWGGVVREVGRGESVGLHALLERVGDGAVWCGRRGVVDEAFGMVTEGL